MVVAITKVGHGIVVTLLTVSQKPLKLTELPAEKSLFVDFLDSLYTHKLHLIKSEEIYRVTEIVLKARAAAETGRVVPL